MKKEPDSAQVSESLNYDEIVNSNQAAELGNRMQPRLELHLKDDYATSSVAKSK
jgi:hypothetical protein